MFLCGLLDERGFVFGEHDDGGMNPKCLDPLRNLPRSIIFQKGNRPKAGSNLWFYRSCYGCRLALNRSWHGVVWIPFGRRGMDQIGSFQFPDIFRDFVGVEAKHGGNFLCRAGSSLEHGEDGLFVGLG